MVDDPLRRINRDITNSILGLDPIRLENLQLGLVVSIYHSAHSVIHAFSIHQHPLSGPRRQWKPISCYVGRHGDLAYGLWHAKHWCSHNFFYVPDIPSQVDSEYQKYGLLAAPHPIFKLRILHLLVPYQQRR